MLGATCDNASNNDAMIDELAELIPTFGGAPSWTRCFLHVVNLVAKSLIWQFDVKKGQTPALESESDKQMQETLLELSENIEREEEETLGTYDDSTTDDPGGDNDEGWVDKIEQLSEDE
jgi:hypothetical protein